MRQVKAGVRGQMANIVQHCTIKWKMSHLLFVKDTALVVYTMLQLLNIVMEFVRVCKRKLKVFYKKEK